MQVRALDLPQIERDGTCVCLLLLRRLSRGGRTGCGGTHPDVFARRTNGAGVVINVRPDDRIAPVDAEAFATAAGSKAVGWQYRRLGEPPAAWTASVRWLAGYRHPRCYGRDWLSSCGRSSPRRNARGRRRGLAGRLRRHEPVPIVPDPRGDAA